LKEQIENYAPRLTALGYVPQYVYWGGGTPSILSPDQIVIIGDALQQNFDLSRLREYSVESSPETLTTDKIRAFRNIGMNRLSIGVQSFNEAELRRAGRAHSSREAKDAVQNAKEQGCENLNIDIITGFPKQTPEILAQTLETTIKLRPEHITAYNYYAIDGTVMARQIARGHVCDIGAAQRAMAQDQAHRILTTNGYSDYMPMYYSIRSANRFFGECYYFDWHGDYMGFGSGAVSILAHHMLMNKRGELGTFISSPTVFDGCERMGLSRAFEDAFSLLSLGRRLNYERFKARYGFEFSLLLNQPQVRAIRAFLDWMHAPLVTAESEAYISTPEGGWHGADTLRLMEKVSPLLVPRG
jgi:oxygen-independent coproporphyrinogen-3 oxidase